MSLIALRMLKRDKRFQRFGGTHAFVFAINKKAAVENGGVSFIGITRCGVSLRVLKCLAAHALRVAAKGHAAKQFVDCHDSDMSTFRACVVLAR